jgi:cytochrome d ubiquinol oxidase subunit II
MSLADIWFVLFILIVAGYLILDGFDFGVGILHLPVARTDLERRTFLASIGPVWDGNAVWLVLTGGVLFACFPLAYASLFSGFYLAFMLVLVCLILRAVSIEFRSKEPGRRWRSGWDIAFGLASMGIALLLGVAFGNIVQGMPIDSAGNMSISFIDLLNPFALLFGVTAVVMFALHGSLYLLLKTGGALRERVRALVPRLIVAFGVLLTLVGAALIIADRQIVQRFVHDIWPVIFPIGALIALGSVWKSISDGRDGRAFVSSGVMIGSLLITGGIGMYPNLLISTTDAAYSLTTANAAAADNTLQITLLVALIGMPFVLLYTSGAYYIFRGKAEVEPEGY